MTAITASGERGRRAWNCVRALRVRAPACALAPPPRGSRAHSRSLRSRCRPGRRRGFRGWRDPRRDGEAKGGG
eukprot:3766177-Prymnesium_polylepis.1